MQSAVVYITLPGETISLKSMISGNTIKTNKQDINITKQLEIETLHVGWFWVDQQKIAICHNPIYYQPEINDYNSEYYFCELSNGLVYNLNQMDFEGATKKNKPNIQVGQFLFSRVVEFNHYLKGKLSYINPQSKKEWTTGENLFRELSGGVIVELPFNFVQSLLSSQTKPELFKEISKYTSFEVCVGKNGRIWIKGADAVLIINLLKRCASLQLEQQLNLVNKFASQFINEIHYTSFNIFHSLSNQIFTRILMKFTHQTNFFLYIFWNSLGRKSHTSSILQKIFAIIGAISIPFCDFDFLPLNINFKLNSVIQFFYQVILYSYSHKQLFFCYTKTSIQAQTPSFSRKKIASTAKIF